MSAWVLVLAPFGLYIIISIVDPKYIELLHTEPQGVKMVIGGMIALFIGTLWIRKIVNIEV
jgi:tight adherence protein B